MKNFEDLQVTRPKGTHLQKKQWAQRAKHAAYLLLLPALFLCGCDSQGGGGGGGGGATAIVTVKVQPDCAGLTGCTDIYIDDAKVGDAVAAAGQISKEVSIGVHTIYASGGCDAARIWGPFDRNVPAAGWVETLSCSPEASIALTVEADPGCAGIERDISVKLDGAVIAELQPGEHKALHASSGLHTLEAVSAGGFVWGPVVFDLSGEGRTETLSCNPTAQGPLTVSVSADCPQLDYVQISVNGNYLGQVNCGAHGVIGNFPIGYRSITAVGFKISQTGTYSAGPYEVYLPVTGATFVIPGGDFKPSARSGHGDR